METAEFDCLHDGALLYARKLKACNVHVYLNETKGTVHAYDIVLGSKYVKEVLDPIDKVLWNLCCDELGIDKDDPVRDHKFIIHDYFFILSGVFVEIDGQHHWCDEYFKKKDKVRDLYMQIKYGRKPIRLKIFGVKFTKFDKDGYGIPESKIVDPNMQKEFDKFMFFPYLGMVLNILALACISMILYAGAYGI